MLQNQASWKLWRTVWNFLTHSRPTCFKRRSGDFHVSKGLLIQVVHSHSNHRNQRHIQKLQTSKMEHFAKIVNGFWHFAKIVKGLWPLTIFATCSMLDVGQGSEYASGYHGKLFKRFGKVMDFFCNVMGKWWDFRKLHS